MPLTNLGIELGIAVPLDDSGRVERIVYGGRCVASSGGDVAGLPLVGYDFDREVIV